MLEERLNADLCDHTGPRQPCSCGGAARFAGRHRKTFMSALGPVTLQRAYYHCRACGHGRFPRDAALGMAGTDLSPAVQRMASTAASMVSFAEASTLLEELAEVPVGTKHVERTAEAVGRAIARDEARAPATPAPTAYLGLDGTGIPVRKSETAGRKGKQEDGTARTREVKTRARVDCRAAGRGGPSATRPRFGQLLRSCGERREPRHRSATFRLRPACEPGGGPPRLPLRRPPGRDR